MITRARITTLVAAALGSAVFLYLGLPIPLLLGPMFACLIFGVSGARLQSMGTLGIFFRTFLGVVIGSSVTPDLIRNLPNQGPTLIMIPLFVLAIGLVGYPFLRKVMGFDHATAYYSAMPGGLQDMLIFGAEAGGDVRAMSLIHATRVLVIVSGAPIAMTLFLGLDLTRPPGLHATELPPIEIIVMIASGVAGWKIAERIGMFGASILGPLILTAILSLSGIIHSRPPVEMIWVAQLFIGIAVGANYSGITKRELRVDVFAGLVFSLLLAIVSVIFVVVIQYFTKTDPLNVWLSFLPGGQAEMAMIAILSGADVAFVVTHHLLRIFVVILAAPIVARWFDR